MDAEFPPSPHRRRPGAHGSPVPVPEDADVEEAMEQAGDTDGDTEVDDHDGLLGELYASSENDSEIDQSVEPPVNDGVCFLFKLEVKVCTYMSLFLAEDRREPERCLGPNKTPYAGPLCWTRSAIREVCRFY